MSTPHERKLEKTRKANIRRTAIIQIWQDNPSWSLRECGDVAGVSGEYVRQTLQNAGITQRYRWATPVILPLTSEQRVQKRKAQFWTHVDITADPRECWEWQGCVNKRTGYGQWSYQGSQVSTHRFAYALIHEITLDTQWILHKCDNPICCNPNHLYAGTPADNARDRDSRGRNGRITHPEAWINRPRSLTDQQIANIYARHRQGERVAILAAETGVHQTTIARYLRQYVPVE